MTAGAEAGFVLRMTGAEASFDLRMTGAEAGFASGWQGR